MNYNKYHEPKEYFAFVDYLEFSSESNDYLTVRLDCIDIRLNEEITLNSILGLPSIIISFQYSYQELKGVFSKSYIDILEGKWIKLTTRRSPQSKMSLQIDNGNIEALNLEVSEIIPVSRLSAYEKRRFNNIKNILDIESIGENIPEDEINNLWNSLAYYNHVNVYNVGQGNFNSLCNINNCPLVYFDIGGGVNQNAFTYINPLTICHVTKFIILSHWDLDHIQTAIIDPNTHDKKWLVPIQKLGPTQFRLAYDISQSGSLYLIRRTINNRLFSIIKCVGRSQNDSGLAMLINFQNETILLPGDCNYRKIPGILNIQLDGLIATHHGSKRGLTYYRRNVIPNACGEKMLAYSYGLHNTFHHNERNVRGLYAAKGWHLINHKKTTQGNISMRVGGLNLNVNCILNDLNIQQTY